MFRDYARMCQSYSEKGHIFILKPSAKWWIIRMRTAGLGILRLNYFFQAKYVMYVIYDVVRSRREGMVFVYIWQPFDRYNKRNNKKIISINHHRAVV